MRVNFSAEEKAAVLGIVKVWKRSQIDVKSFDAIQSKYGIPARLAETMFWHLDTLDAIGRAGQLVFKGGTCIQSYVAPELQRASVDLDFNTSIQNPNAIMDAMEDLNKILEGAGRIASVRGVKFGAVEFDFKDEKSGTLSFRRRMPSRFGEFERAGDVDVQSKSIRIQVNYKHSWMPALNTVEKEVAFFVQDAQKPAMPVKFVHASPEDLFADKILATSNIGPFGRERFKDVYDLIVLSGIKPEKKQILKKLDLVGEHSGLDANAILKASIETISGFAEHSLDARGFSSMVCSGGKKIVENWESECEKLSKTVMGLVQ
ncbi:MAG: nucleotidyl transferase AbiEii/AbiGii toxin family protein [Candidatus Thermoplasmatota archaeon]|nr:nucleotidyl transferase AbiEii/AbiGii toxin family protein [Candidatus Thermoplasmatota archaeon]